MILAEQRDRQTGNLHRFAWLDLGRFERGAKEPGANCRQKGIIEALPKVIQRSCHAINGQRLTCNAVQHARFVRAHHMIGVVMGE